MRARPLAKLVVVSAVFILSTGCNDSHESPSLVEVPSIQIENSPPVEPLVKAPDDFALAKPGVEVLETSEFGFPKLSALEAASFTDVANFVIECGAPGEDQKRSGTQAVSLSVIGRPNIEGVQGEWTLTMDTFIDRDTQSIESIQEDGIISGFVIRDKVKNNSNGKFRMIELTGLSECIANRGGEAPDAKAIISRVDINGLKVVSHTIQGCTCAFESNPIEQE